MNLFIYKAPGRTTLAGPLLDKCKEGLSAAVKRDLKGVDSATLVQEGWSNIHNEPVVAHSICCNSKSYILNAVPTYDMEKSAENCAMLLEDAILLAEEEYGVKVTGVCTGIYEHPCGTTFTEVSVPNIDKDSHIFHHFEKCNVTTINYNGARNKALLDKNKTPLQLLR